MYLSCTFLYSSKNQCWVYVQAQFLMAHVAVMKSSNNELCFNGPFLQCCLHHIVNIFLSVRGCNSAFVVRSSEDEADLVSHEGMDTEKTAFLPELVKLLPKLVFSLPLPVPMLSVYIKTIDTQTLSVLPSLFFWRIKS